MGIEISIAAITTVAILLLAVHAWWTMPLSDFVSEAVEVGYIAAELPPPKRRDVLDDYEAELAFQALTAEASATHRLALLHALLEEADHETTRLEVLVDQMGQRLVPST